MKTRIDSNQMKQKAQGVAADSAERTLKRAMGYGALFGLILAPMATAIAVGFDSALIYFRYAIHWAVGFAVIGAWAGAMFFSGEYSAVGHLDGDQVKRTH